MTVSLDALLPTATGAHVSTTYADWADAHDPDMAGAARDVVAEMGAELNRFWSKPGRFVDTMAVRARRLPPAHLPWFWDTVGHRLIGHGGKPGGRAYTAARAAEAEHELAVDAGYRRANALLFARGGAMPAKEFAAHQRFLAETSEPVAAHAALATFLTAWTASPADLPADLVRRVKASAKAAGHGEAEAARLVGELLAVTRNKSVPDALLNAAATLLRTNRPTDTVATGLLGIFPDGATDGGAWLRMLIASGATEGMESGRVVPQGGLRHWVGNFVRMYQYAAQSGGGVARQQLPAELCDLVERLGPRLRAEGGDPLTVHTTRHHYQGFDADVLDACLAAGVEVVDPGPQVRMRFWGDRSRRDLQALAADPVFGPRLEETVHATLLPEGFMDRRRRPGTAVTLLPGNKGIARHVAARVDKLLATVAAGGMAGAEEALTELELLLDGPTVEALDGMADALAGASTAGTLRRSLMAGLPEELAWPALERIYEDFATEATEAAEGEGGPLPGVSGVTSTWPVLTVFGRHRAVAVAPDGVRASCRYTIPDDATMFAVHYVGGSFLVSWTAKPNPYYCDTAIWSDHPDDPFAPDEVGGLVPYGGSLDGAYGFQFETADGGGRHGGTGVLRPGGKQGIDRDELQLGDGSTIWTNAVFAKQPWQTVDPLTGEREAVAPLPAFLSAPTDSDMTLATEALQLAPLPKGLPASPLGTRDGLLGTRVSFRTDHPEHAPDHYLLESVDGRTARFTIDRKGQEPWALWAPPEAPEGEAVVLAEAQTKTGVRAYTSDGTLLWEQDGHHSPRHPRVPPTRHLTVSGGVALPPAFWYVLQPRDRTASQALRATPHQTADTLLSAALESEESLNAAMATEFPTLTDPVLRRAVTAVAERAAIADSRRRTLHRRITSAEPGTKVGP